MKKTIEVVTCDICMEELLEDDEYYAVHVGTIESYTNIDVCDECYRKRVSHTLSLLDARGIVRYEAKRLDSRGSEERKAQASKTPGLIESTSGLFPDLEGEEEEGEWDSPFDSWEDASEDDDS